MDDINDMIFPEVYKKTKGAGFPSTNFMNRRKDINVIKYPHVKHIPNPMILCGTWIAEEESKYEICVQIS